MILKIDPNGCITLPESFMPGENVLLLPLPGGCYKLIRAVDASREEVEQALEGEMRESAAAYRQLVQRQGAARSPRFNAP